MLVIFMVLHITHHDIHSNPAICFPNQNRRHISHLILIQRQSKLIWIGYIDWRLILALAQDPLLRSKCLP